MTAVEVIRRAAALMRERAKTATPGPWHNHSRERHVVDFGPGVSRHDTFAVVHSDGPEGQSAADAEHIASWHPAVALAVADWLDDVAQATEDDESAVMPTTYEFEHAHAVARAYLGEP